MGFKQKEVYKTLTLLNKKQLQLLNNELSLSEVGSKDQLIKRLVNHHPKQNFKQVGGADTKLELDDWIKLAKEKDLLFKWSDLKNMTLGATIDLTNALDQASNTPDKVFSPVDFFEKTPYRKESETTSEVIMKNLNKDRSEVFTEYEGNATTGGGGNHYMKWSDLSTMPKVFF